MTIIDAEVESAYSPVKTVGLLSGIFLFAIMLFSPPPEGLSAEGWKVLAITMLMAVWWMTEAIPVAMTALVPLVAIPFLGLGEIPDAAHGFTSKAVFLPLGGFILGISLQRWNLHQRIALHTVKLVGTSPRQVIAGFMIATAFVSMWITNTATTVMMLPIAFSVASLLIDEGKGDARDKEHFGICMMLGIAYAASVGGMMTLVGTSTNVMFKGYVEQEYGLVIGFGQWMLIGVPVGVTMLAAMWWGMTHILFPCRMERHDGISTLIDARLEALGRMSAGEKRTLAVFSVTACLWIFGQTLEDYIGVAFNDASIAIAAALALFILPSGMKKGEKLMTWKDTKEMPWGILLLLAGGLTMAHYMDGSGVADWLGTQLATLHDVPLWVIVLLATAIMIFITELMSNVAALTALLPVIAAVSADMGINPMLLAVPLTLTASCSFMLPIGTPPNAIVFGSGLLKIRHMVRAGVVYDLFGILLINGLCAIIVPLVF